MLNSFLFWTSCSIWNSHSIYTVLRVYAIYNSCKDTPSIPRQALLRNTSTAKWILYITIPVYLTELAVMGVRWTAFLGGTSSDVDTVVDTCCSCCPIAPGIHRMCTERKDWDWSSWVPSRILQIPLNLLETDIWIVARALCTLRGRSSIWCNDFLVDFRSRDFHATYQVDHSFGTIDRSRWDVIFSVSSLIWLLNVGELDDSWSIIFVVNLVNVFLLSVSSVLLQEF